MGRLVLVALGVVAPAACGPLPEGWLYTSRVTATEATVAWTDPGADGVVCRDPAGGVVRAAAAGRPGRLRHARLVGLAPATRYRCRLEGRDGRPAARVRFRTAPAGREAFRFAVVGDSGDRSPETTATARRILAGRPAFLLHVGDLSYVRDDAVGYERRFFEPYRRLLRRVPFFPTPGNHDLESRSAYREIFAPVADGSDGGDPRYAFEWGGVSFVSVSSIDLARDGGTARWLTETLAAAPSRNWRVVFLHEPPWSPGAKAVTRGLRAAVAGVLAAERVDLLLAGHEHLYARTVPICTGTPGVATHQVISGGGGGTSLDPARRHPNFPVVLSATHHLRVRVTPESIDVRAVDLDGRVRDRVRIGRAASVACRAEGWPPPREKDR